jgi:hypothetical protein
LCRSVISSSSFSSFFFARHPLLRGLRPFQCVLRAGELLFVPQGCPHRVETLTDSVAVSANFVDRSNLSCALEELRVDGLLNPRAGDLRSQLAVLGATD